MLIVLSTILITGGLTIAPVAYSTGGGDDSHGDDSHGKNCGDDSHGDDSHGNDCNPEPDCDCKKPTIFSVIYNGPGVENEDVGPDAEVTVEIYKKIGHIGEKDPLLTIEGIFDGESIIIDSNVYGKKKIHSSTVYRVIQNDAEIAVISFHTSCSQPLFIGDMHSDGPVTVTVESGVDHKGRQSIFLQVDPICNEVPETTLKVKKILSPEDDLGTFILQIDGVPVTDPVGNGGTTGEVDVIPGAHTVGEIVDLTQYTQTIGGDCNDDGTITLEEGDDAVCTITNTKIVPVTLTLKKAITNDNNGLHTDPTLFDTVFLPTISGDAATFGENIITPGEHTIGEAVVDGYSFVLIAGDTACPSMLDEPFTITKDITCILYNDDDFVPGGNEGDPPTMTITVDVRNLLGVTADQFEYAVGTDGNTYVDGSTVILQTNIPTLFMQTNFNDPMGPESLILPTSIEGDGNCPDVIGTGGAETGLVTLSANQDIECIVVYGFEVEPGVAFGHKGFTFSTVQSLVTDDGNGFAHNYMGPRACSSGSFTDSCVEAITTVQGEYLLIIVDSKLQDPQRTLVLWSMTAAQLNQPAAVDCNLVAIFTSNLLDDENGNDLNGFALDCGDATAIEWNINYAFVETEFETTI